jgi:hypothetical protein
VLFSALQPNDPVIAFSRWQSALEPGSIGYDVMFSGSQYLSQANPE